MRNNNNNNIFLHQVILLVLLSILIKHFYNAGLLLITEYFLQCCISHFTHVKDLNTSSTTTSCPRHPGRRGLKKKESAVGVWTLNLFRHTRTLSSCFSPETVQSQQARPKTVDPQPSVTTFLEEVKVSF